MRKLLAATAVAAALTAAPAMADNIEVGRLSCDIGGGTGYLIGSQKDIDCTFIKKNGADQHYSGTISKLGFDIGVTQSARLEWVVFAAKGTSMGGRPLGGTYVGGSGEWTLGAGVGANWLVGGFDNSIMLQPWSVQVQKGLNLSLTGTALRLH